MTLLNVRQTDFLDQSFYRDSNLSVFPITFYSMTTTKRTNKYNVVRNDIILLSKTHKSLYYRLREFKNQKLTPERNSRIWDEESTCDSPSNSQWDKTKRVMSRRRRVLINGNNVNSKESFLFYSLKATLTAEKYPEREVNDVVSTQRTEKDYL